MRFTLNASHFTFHAVRSAREVIPFLLFASLSACSVVTQPGSRDLAGSTVLRTDSAFRFIVFSPDGQLLAAAGKLWSVSDGREIARYGGGSGSSVAFSGDGQLLARSAGKRIILWSVPERKEIAALPGHERMVWCLAFSPDTQWIASGTILAMGADKGPLRNRRRIDPKRNPNPSERPKINDTIIKLWSVADGQAVATFKGHVGDIYTLAITYAVT
jgi:hypothetical protein